MDEVPIRELQQHASAVVRRVRRGETVGITDRGTLVAVMSPPSDARGAAALVASGRVRRATRRIEDLRATYCGSACRAPMSGRRRCSTSKRIARLEDLACLTPR